MSARTSGLLAVAALVLASVASAQVASGVSSAPLAQVDPWGVGWLSKSDGPLPATIWANTTAEALGPLYAGLKPGELSPSARTALRRIALSPAKAPADGAALIPERLRLIEELGETERSIDLRKRFPDTPWGKGEALLASEFELAKGQSQTACARVADRKADDPDWMPLRAFCYALAGDFNASSALSERLPAGADGQPNVWLLSALQTMQAPVAKKPEGRYGAPFEAAVSVAAKLSVPANAFSDTPPDIAAAVVQHPNATLEQKRAALRPALDGGKIKPAEVLAVLALKDETPSAKSAAQRNAARMDFLALAQAAATSEEAKVDAKATAYAAALKSVETLSDFRFTAAALSDAIKTLPKNGATAPNAETFARVALLLGDLKQAGEWRKQVDEKADPWAAARIDLMLSYAGAAGDKPGAILDRLIAAVPPPPEPGAKPAPPTPQSRQIDLRRIENTRVMFLFTGTGRNLTADQRASLASQKTAGRGVSDAAIARISSAEDQNADGEAALAAIALLGSDVSALSFAGLADLLTQLRRAGFEKDADAIALEALQVWKAL